MDTNCFLSAEILSHTKVDKSGTKHWTIWDRIDTTSKPAIIKTVTEKEKSLKGKAAFNCITLKEFLKKHHTIDHDSAVSNYLFNWI